MMLNLSIINLRWRISLRSHLVNDKTRKLTVIFYYFYFHQIHVESTEQRLAWTSREHLASGEVASYELATKMKMSKWIQSAHASQFRKTVTFIFFFQALLRSTEISLLQLISFSSRQVTITNALMCH